MKKHFLFSVLLSFLCAVPAWAWDNMYLIGDATDAGWTLENAVVMTKINEAEFEWSGKLQAGELCAEYAMLAPASVGVGNGIIWNPGDVI